MALPLLAQTTSFTDDFEDGIMTGWSVDDEHLRTYELSEANGFMTIDYHRVASSWEWDNFNFTAQEEIDISETPEISIKIKSTVATKFSVKPIYSNGNDDWVDQNLSGDGIWQTYIFSLDSEKYSGGNLTKIYFYLDAGSTSETSGTISIDDMVIGTGEFVLRVTDLTAETRSESEIFLDWNCNDTTLIDHYEIFRSEDAGVICENPIDSTTVSKYLDEELTLGQTYYYKVMAIDTNGISSEASNEASARTYDMNAGPVVFVESTNANTVGVYEKFEINVGLENATYENPYDPDEIDLRAVFISPSDSVWVVNGFYDNYNNRDQWKIRFSPDETGTWTYYLMATDESGTGESGSSTFVATETSHKGWLRISDDNPKYFEYDNGENFYGVGVYYPWQMNTTGLDIMKNSGCNLVGFWNIMYDKGYILESMDSGLGKYDQNQCNRIDEIITMAEDYDMKAMFAIWPHDLISETVWAHQWHNNPYSNICTVNEFFSDEEAWEYQKKQYRYLIARWGYSRGMGIWEIVNEINGTDGWQNGYTAEGELWTKKVSHYLRENDPFKHPNTASQSGGKWWPNGYEVIDIANVHMYETQLFSAKYSSNFMRSSMYAYQYISQKFWSEFTDKPGFFGEAGATDSYGDYEAGSDEYTTAYHNSLWVTWACGNASTPIWWDYFTLVDADFEQLGAFEYFISQHIDYLDFSHKVYEAMETSSADCDVFIMENDTSGFGWLRQFYGENVSGSSFTLSGLENLTYVVDFYDTWSGEYLASETAIPEEGEASVLIPNISHPDVAFVIKPQAFGETPHHLELTANPTELMNDEESTSELRCLIKDETGLFCGNATNEITFTINGSGSFTSANVVNAAGGIVNITYLSPSTTGIMQIIASSPGLISDTVDIEITSALNFDDFENYDNDDDLANYWKVRSTSQAKIYLDQSLVYDGEQSMKMQYNIGNGASPFATIYRTINEDLSRFNYLGFWYKPAGTNRQIAVRLTENNGNNWDYYLDLDEHIGKYIEIFFDDFTGSADSMNLDDMAEISINVMKGNGEFGEGQLFFDSFKFLIDKTIVSIDNPGNLVKKFQLDQNFPNPFNPETTIEFRIQKSSDIQLQVFDLRGNLVEILINDFRQAGNYRIIWNATNHPSGVYLYKLIAGDNIEMKKCILLK